MKKNYKKGMKELIDYVEMFYGADYIDTSEDSNFDKLMKKSDPNYTRNIKSIFPEMFNNELSRDMIEDSIIQMYGIAKQKNIIFVHSIFGWDEKLTNLLVSAGESEIRELVRDFMLVKYGYSKADDTEFSEYLKTYFLDDILRPIKN